MVIVFNEFRVRCIIMRVRKSKNKIKELEGDGDVSLGRVVSKIVK